MDADTKPVAAEIRFDYVAERTVVSCGSPTAQTKRVPTPHGLRDAMVSEGNVDTLIAILDNPNATKGRLKMPVGVPVLKSEEE